MVRGKETWSAELRGILCRLKADLHTRNKNIFPSPGNAETDQQEPFFQCENNLIYSITRHYVQKHKYINICDTKINIFSCFLLLNSLFMHLLCWLSLRPRGRLHLGGCSLPVSWCCPGIAVSWPLKTAWWKSLRLPEREEERRLALQKKKRVQKRVRNMWLWCSKNEDKHMQDIG